MGLLDSLFGSKKTTTTSNTTNATQNTSNVSADGGSILSGNDTNYNSQSWTDNSQRVDYRVTDSRDLSQTTSLTDNSNNSQSYSDSSQFTYSDSRDMSQQLSYFDARKENSDNTTVFTDGRDMSTYDASVSNDNRSYSSIKYELTPDVVKAALASIDKQNALAYDTINKTENLRSADSSLAIDRTYNASLAFFNTSANALRDAYESSTDALAENTVRTINAVEAANRTDGQAIIDTVNNFGKYGAYLIGAAILVALLRSR